MPAIMQVSGNERKWLDHYEQLKKYMETHGNCNVTIRHESLGRWVSEQRRTYRLLKEGKSSPMTDDRIRKLESIGFQWNLRALINKEQHVLWHERFQEMKEFKAKHGNCNVPTRHESLGSWVSHQRQTYRLLKEGKSSQMTDDRIRKLESMGFQWISERANKRVSGRATTIKERHVLWRERFQELKEFKAKHGNCNVPAKHESLGTWVRHQRWNYRLLKEGKSSPMPDDRIRKLESIGFQWIGRALINKEQHVLWHERYQELKEFKAKHGNCNVPAKHESLGRWVRYQRWNYRLLKEGKSSPITDDRIRKLESIGFCWSRKRQHDYGETYPHTTYDAPPNPISGRRNSLRSTSSTTANAPDIVTSAMDFEDSHTNDEAAACDISCAEHIEHSSNDTCVAEVPAFRPFLLGTGYC